MKYLNAKNKKIILEAKLKGQVNLTLPLLFNQNQQVKSRAEVILMRINKWIHGGPSFKVASSKICKEMGTILPEQEMINCNANFIQKQMTTHKTQTLQRYLAFLSLSTSKLYHKQPE